MRTPLRTCVVPESAPFRYAEPAMSTVLARVDDAVTELGAAAALPRIAPAAARALCSLYSSCAAHPLTLRGAPWQLQWGIDAPRLSQREAFRFRLGPYAGVVAI